MTRRLISTAEGTEAGAFARTDWLLIWFAGVTWGASFLFMAEGLESYEPGLITFLRVLFGFLTLTFASRRRVPIERGDWPRLVMLGLVWMAVPLTLFPIAQQHISSSLAGMINGATPVAVAVVATLLLGRLPGPAQQAGLVVGVVGLVMIGWPSLDEGGNSALGVALVLVAVACYGVAFNMAVPLQQRYGSINVLWHVLAVALVATMPFGLASGPGSSPELVPTIAIIALGAGGTGLAFVAVATVVGRTGSTRASVTVYLTPPVAIGLGVWLRDETVEAVTVAGAALVLLGAWLTGRADTRRRATPRTAIVSRPPDGDAGG